MNKQEIRKEALAMAIKTMRDEKKISSLLESGEIGEQLPDLPVWISFSNECVKELTL